MRFMALAKKWLFTVGAIFCVFMPGIMLALPQTSGDVSIEVYIESGLRGKVVTVRIDDRDLIGEKIMNGGGDILGSYKYHGTMGYKKIELYVNTEGERKHMVQYLYIYRDTALAINYINIKGGQDLLLTIF